MQKSSISFVFTLLVVYVFLAAPTVLAAPILYQCEAPMQTVGSLGLRVPAPIPQSGELLIKFQRTSGESTQASINFSGVKELKVLLDQIVKLVNEEVAQRAPKMAAVRERGLDQTQSASFGPVTVIAINEVFRFSIVYDPQDVQVSFQGPNNYAPLCFQLTPIREIPTLTDIKIESRPKLLFVGFPERATSGQPTQGAVAFADADDDTAQLRFDYHSEDGSTSNTMNLDLALPIGAGAFGAGLKAVRFTLTVECRRDTKFLATIVARDKKNQQSEPLTFDFICER